jgi:hypothetical protein
MELSTTVVPEPLHVAVISPRPVHNNFLFALICDADGKLVRSPCTWPNSWQHTTAYGKVVTFTHYPTGFPLSKIDKDDNTLLLMYTGRLTWSFDIKSTAEHITQFLEKRIYFNMTVPGTLEVNKSLPDEINMPDELGQTPLMQACTLKREDVALVLLNTKGVDIHTPNDAGVTPLMAATNMGHTKVIRKLKEMGAEK